MVKKLFFILVALAIPVVVSFYAIDFAYSKLEKDINAQVSRSEDINKLSAISKKKIKYIIEGTGPYKNYVKIDKDLGWSIKDNGKSGERYSSNSIGIRGRREYAESKPDNIRYRIAAFGDSFTHSDDVSDDETWLHFVEEKDKSLEAMNFGVGGYGTDQAWLRYQLKGKAYNPDIVLIGIMTENINRNVNYFVPFYRRLSSPASKPRFILNNNNKLELLENSLRSRNDYLRLSENPGKYLKEFGKNDYFYRRVLQSKYNNKYTRFLKYVYMNIKEPWVLNAKGQYNVNSEPYKVSLAILEEFYKEVIRQGSTPLIVVFPEASDVQKARSGLPKRHQPMLDELEKRRLNYVDILDGFKQRDELSIGKLFKGHYTEYANRIVADVVLEVVNQM